MNQHDPEPKGSLELSLDEALAALRGGKRLTYRLPRVAESFPLAEPPPAVERREAAPGSLPLREVRLERGWSVEALAARSGISASTIYRIERDSTTPRPHVVRHLSAALGVAPWDVTEFRPVLKSFGLPNPTVRAQERR